MMILPRNAVRSISSNFRLRWVFHYSTSATNVNDSSFMVDYLVNSLGFSKERAIVTSSKVSGFNSIVKPNSVVEFLRSSGFDKSHIENLVSSVPKILLCDVDKTLKPKVKAFQDLGLSGSDLADVFSSCPEIYQTSLDAHIKPTIEALKSVFGENDGNMTLLGALKASPRMLASGIPKMLPENVSLLQNYGLSRDKIKALLLKKPKYFAMDPKWLRAILIRVEKKLGIPRDSSMFYHGICALACLSEEKLELKIEIYKSLGWTESDVLTLFRKSPYAMKASESRIRKVLNFFMKDLGYKPTEILRNPSIVGFSLEKRIIPRNVALKILKENGLLNNNYCFVSYLHMSEDQFFKKLVLPFKNAVPHLYEDYMKRVCSPLEAAK